MMAIIHKRFNAGIMNTAIYMTSCADEKRSEGDPSQPVNVMKSNAEPAKSFLTVLHKRSGW